MNLFVYIYLLLYFTNEYIFYNNSVWDLNEMLSFHWSRVILAAGTMQCVR